MPECDSVSRALWNELRDLGDIPLAIGKVSHSQGPFNLEGGTIRVYAGKPPDELDAEGEGTAAQQFVEELLERKSCCKVLKPIGGFFINGHNYKIHFCPECGRRLS